MTYKKSPHSPSQIARDKFEKGASISEIVEHFAALGLTRTYRQVCSSLRKNGFAFRDKVDHGRVWTAEEDRAITVAVQSGRIGLENLANMLYRRTRDVRRRIAKLDLVYADSVKVPLRPAPVPAPVPAGRDLGITMDDLIALTMDWGIAPAQTDNHWGQ